MTINQPDLLRKTLNAIPQWRNDAGIRNFIEQLIILLSQTATATGESGDGGDTTIINEAENAVLSTVQKVDDLYSITEDLQRQQAEYPLTYDERLEDLERQMIDVMMGADTGFKSFAIDGGIHEATDREFITAGLNATILLPSRPVTDSVIIVKKIDSSRVVQVGGNGKTIDSHSSINIRNQNTALLFHYDITRDAWFIR